MIIWLPPTMILKVRLAAQANSKSQEHLWFAHKNQVEACYLRFLVASLQVVSHPTKTKGEQVIKQLLRFLDPPNHSTCDRIPVLVRRSKSRSACPHVFLQKHLCITLLIHHLFIFTVYTLKNTTWEGEHCCNSPRWFAYPRLSGHQYQWEDR